MNDDETNWKRMQFKKNKVWLATDRDQKPVVKNGKVLIKYQLGQDYEYWVNPKNIKSIDSVEIETKKTKNKKSTENAPKKRKTKVKPKTESLDHTEYKDAICIYTDGPGSIGNRNFTAFWRT